MAILSKIQNSKKKSKRVDLRVGVIGVGYLGQFHAEKYAQMPNVKLTGVVDRNINRARDVAKRYFTNAYADYHELFGQVDAVSIAVSTSSHFNISKECLENNIDVLIEKPITTTIEEADELIQCAEARRLIIQVGHLERYNPAVVALENIIKKPMFIESQRLSIFKNRGTDVSVVLDLMIHDIDIIYNFVRSPVKSIQATGIPVVSNHTDIANVRLEFENGCVANVTASRISTRNKRKIRLFQRENYVSVNFASQEITIIGKNGAGDDPNQLIPGMGIQTRRFPEGDALEEELKAFVRSVKDRHNPEVNGKIGRQALEIAINIMNQINSQMNFHLKDN